ncbi:hypothetical protein GCM10028806_19720 [Spirosoma terrae]|uniref:Uncharacterized protein n=1 Tax=Spirosoma terrae TaxID=1968276 RepID=A0A6L9L5Q6_9BACT|nr:hypothetical protein [Spirosoma terrae]NDU94712.1 hypothetical protein [Spirosoma terrae]
MGAIPFFVRLFIYFFSTKLKIDYIVSEVDMVTFGLVLNVSNINELDGRSDLDERKKSIYVGLSTVAIIIFGVILGVAYVADIDKTKLFNADRIKIGSAVLSIVSLIFSYSFIVKRD